MLLPDKYINNIDKRMLIIAENQASSEFSIKVSGMFISLGHSTDEKLQ